MVENLLMGLRVTAVKEVTRLTPLDTSRTPVIFAGSDAHSRKRVMDLYDELHSALLAHLGVLGRWPRVH